MRADSRHHWILVDHNMVLFGEFCGIVDMLQFVECHKHHQGAVNQPKPKSIRMFFCLLILNVKCVCLTIKKIVKCNVLSVKWSG